jgi:hypothetical protein
LCGQLLIFNVHGCINSITTGAAVSRFHGSSVD